MICGIYIYDKNELGFKAKFYRFSVDSLILSVIAEFHPDRILFEIPHYQTLTAIEFDKLQQLLEFTLMYCSTYRSQLLKIDSDVLYKVDIRNPELLIKNP